MKIGEAVLEIEHLEQRLEVLQARMRNDHGQGRPLTYLLEKVESTANRLRDLQIATEWTYQNVVINKMPLGSYAAKREQIERLLEILESVDSPDLREKIDELHEAKKEITRVINTVYWTYDLMLPEVKVPNKSEEEN
ncbi:MAG: hypothetical protein GF334_01475 [Candidatus Altiarchaeales archaeon]|nr:hypothetical protein [Candidatus Altiarchaeales archaeon]